MSQNTLSMPNIALATPENNTTAKISEEYQEAVQIWMPCNLLSDYHDLQCGHRIETTHDKLCGTNCAFPGRHTPFLCKQYIIEAVQTGLDLHAEDEQAQPGTNISDTALPTGYLFIETNSIAEMVVMQEIEDMCKGRKYRHGEPVPKFDGVAAFLRDMPYARVED
ncbi:hypothetical protein K458DRAFT_389530 [Lentithecium fluviatile CBS 122367]|uniref:Uncharacterized protein n=1 Tax=Lentithecium fluviatile CBS 122367 TaxID=1168545 RepID=A0A6G1IZD6_9PLEO|nr:hypothetical protein K458DRAFT_389530 [Lentithecium fluviatile CBS 122367]